MKDLKVSTVGAWCAIGLVTCFVLGVVAMASSGVQVLIPETGSEGRAWIADVDGAGNLFFVGAWLIILMGFLGIGAYLAFWEVLRDAGRVMLLAPVLGVFSLTLVTLSHLVPIAMAYQLVPDYVAAPAAEQATLATTADTLASLAVVVNSAGNFLGWGVVVPLLALAILRTDHLPHWIGWLGLGVGVCAGWVGMLFPLGAVFEAVSTIGFLGFFVFVAATGVSILRRERTPHLRPTPAM